MSSIDELQKLADQLTELAPPPFHPQGVNLVVPGTGRWLVMRLGAGMYALRAEYRHPEGDNEITPPVIVASQNEMRGYPSTLATALRFSISILDSGRHQWKKV